MQSTSKTRVQPPASRERATPPLRILTYLNSFEPGGVERVALRLNDQWRRMGVDVTVVIGRHSDAASPSAMALDQAVDYLLIPGGDQAGRRPNLLSTLRHLPGIIRRTRPDILFCAGNTYSLIAVAMKFLLGRDCPPIIAKISNDLVRRDMGWLLRFWYQRWLWLQGRIIDHFVGMAPAMTEEIAHAMHVGHDRITIINDPVLREAELAHLANKRAAGDAVPGERQFIAVGRLMRQKNFSLLIAAFARIASRTDRLTILGDGPEHAALVGLAQTLGVAGRIAMPGHVDNVFSWLGAADIFVMSSDYEGVPAVLVEAIAANLDVVATDCSVSMRDLVGGGAFGRLVPVGDETALAAAMATARPVERNRVAALAHVRQFTVEQGAARYLALMQRMVRETAIR